MAPLNCSVPPQLTDVSAGIGIAAAEGCRAGANRRNTARTVNSAGVIHRTTDIKYERTGIVNVVAVGNTSIGAGNTVAELQRAAGDRRATRVILSCAPRQDQRAISTFLNQIKSSKTSTDTSTQSGRGSRNVIKQVYLIQQVRQL